MLQLKKDEEDKRKREEQEERLRREREEEKLRKDRDREMRYRARQEEEVGVIISASVLHTVLQPVCSSC